MNHCYGYIYPSRNAVTPATADDLNSPRYIGPRGTLIQLHNGRYGRDGPLFKSLTAGEGGAGERGGVNLSVGTA